MATYISPRSSLSGSIGITDVPSRHLDSKPIPRARPVSHPAATSTSTSIPLSDLHPSASTSDTVVIESNDLEKWNSPTINLVRTSATFWSLFLLGLNDGTYGAILPYLETHYELSYTLVSLIFLSPMVGYVLSALTNAPVHERFGQRGVAFISPGCHMAGYLIVAFHPPFPVLVIVYVLVGFGSGLADAAWNAWIGGMHAPNQILGVLHACYGLGAAVAPICATALIVRLGWAWWSWYWILLGAAALEGASCLYAFWARDAAHYRSESSKDDTSSKGLAKALVTKPTARIIWLASFFLLGYVGVEVALGGWIVTFMRKERDGQALASSYAATGFWMGITVGRLVLGFVTPRFGEKLSIAVYLPIAFALQLLFWLVPSFTVSAVAVAFQGFFLGPLFPAGVVVCTKLLPKRLHVSGIGFAAALGGAGGAVLPFATGALAQAKGVQVLQPIVLALLVTIWLLWVALPRIERKRE